MEATVSAIQDVILWQQKNNTEEECCMIHLRLRLSPCSPLRRWNLSGSLRVIWSERLPLSSECIQKGQACHYNTKDPPSFETGYVGANHYHLVLKVGE